MKLIFVGFGTGDKKVVSVKVAVQPETIEDKILLTFLGQHPEVTIQIPFIEERKKK